MYRKYYQSMLLEYYLFNVSIDVKNYHKQDSCKAGNRKRLH